MTTVCQRTTYWGSSKFDHTSSTRTALPETGHTARLTLCLRESPGEKGSQGSTKLGDCILGMPVPASGSCCVGPHLLWLVYCRYGIRGFHAKDAKPVVLTRKIIEGIHLTGRAPQGTGLDIDMRGSTAAVTAPDLPTSTYLQVL